MVLLLLVVVFVILSVLELSVLLTPTVYNGVASVECEPSVVVCDVAVVVDPGFVCACCRHIGVMIVFLLL